MTPSGLSRLRDLSVLAHRFPGGFRFGEYLRRTHAAQDREILLTDFDGDLKMYVNLSDHIGGQIYWHGHYSIAQLAVVGRLLRPDHVVLDVGANVGEFTLFAAKRVHRGRVCAFEPVQAMCRLARRNLQANGFANADVFQIGLSDANETLSIYRSIERGGDGALNNGLNSIFPSADINSAEMIDVMRLDDWCDRHRITRLDVVKLDVEGAELAALRGGESTLRRLKPALIVEVNEATCERAGYSTTDLLEYILGLGYSLHNIGRDGALERVVDLGRVTRDVLCTV